jgi:hypothetical protein
MEKLVKIWGCGPALCNVHAWRLDPDPDLRIGEWEISTLSFLAGHCGQRLPRRGAGRHQQEAGHVGGREDQNGNR